MEAIHAQIPSNLQVNYQQWSVEYMEQSRYLQTRRGRLVPLPAYIPISTFGCQYELDYLLRPYFPRLAKAWMVSYSSAQEERLTPLPVFATTQPLLELPVFMDSGSVALPSSSARVVEEGGLGILEIERNGLHVTIHPSALLDSQEKFADIAFTLDFPMFNADEQEAKRRQHLTITNAYWALHNRRARNLLLYACVQGWDVESMRACARAYKGFDGIALGNLAGHFYDITGIIALIKAIREVVGDLPLHVCDEFHLNGPSVLQAVFQAGADSISSSSYAKLAEDGQLWGQSVRLPGLSREDQVKLAICNLASATQQPLPLSAHRMVSQIQSLFLRGQTQSE